MTDKPEELNLEDEEYKLISIILSSNSALALADLLIEKEVITQQEFNDKLRTRVDEIESEELRNMIKKALEKTS